MYIQHNMEVRSCNHCYSGEAISITYYECMCVALIIQHAVRLCHIVIHVQYFFTLSHTLHD